MMFLYEGVTIPTAFYRAEAWGIRSVERSKENVLEIIIIKKGR